MYSLDFSKKGDSKIITKECDIRDTGKKYAVLKYDEKYVCDNDEDLGMYRSVIYSLEDEQKERLVCYTPPKSITMELFRERNPTMNDDVFISEVIEGTMLSLFWNDGWEIASKGSIGGNYWFYRTQYEPTTEKQKTFRQMFIEAIKGVGDINDIEFIKSLPKETGEGEIYCYNFVLQHPENHIVLAVPYPRLVLVSVYKLKENTATIVQPSVYYPWFSNANCIVELPKPIEYNETAIYPRGLPGIMFLNVKTGDRTSWENPAYKELKELRGNHPNLHYQYLCLRRIDKVMDFLAYFPQYKKVFHKFYNQFEDFVTKVHKSYVSYYVKKEGTPISKKYFLVIHKIHHEVYLPTLASSASSPSGKLIMRRDEIRKALLNMPPNILFYYLYLQE